MQNNLGYNLGRIFAIAEYICDLATKKTSRRYNISGHCRMFAMQPSKLLDVIDQAKVNCSILLKRKGVCLDTMLMQYTQCFEVITCENIQGQMSLDNQANFLIGYHQNFQRGNPFL